MNMAPDTTIDLPRAAKPAIQERLLTAAREMAAELPLESVTLAEVARRARVSWPTARRYLGSKEKLHALLQLENLDRVAAGPGTRERILAAAARVFARRGHDGATLDEVGAEAGMTKGAVYWHFANKSELFLALVRQQAEAGEDAMPERLEAALRMDDAREGLARILALQLAALRNDPVPARLLLEFIAASRDRAVQDAVAQVYRRGQQTAAELVASLKLTGRVSERADPAAVAVLWTALLDGLSLLSLVDPDRIEPEKLAPQLVELLWNGLKRRYGGV